MGKLLKDEIQPHILAKKSFSPHIIPKTKGLDENLNLCSRRAFFVVVGKAVSSHSRGHQFESLSWCLSLSREIFYNVVDFELNIKR